MPPVGFEPAIPASERPQTYALDRSATGTGTQYGYCHINVFNYLQSLFYRLLWTKFHTNRTKVYFCIFSFLNFQFGKGKDCVMSDYAEVCGCTHAETSRL